MISKPGETAKNKEMIKKTIQYIIVGLLLSTWLFVFQHKEATRDFVQTNLGINRPCSKPLTYAIGNVDSQFGVSEAELKTLTQEAEAVWEKPSGKNLFEYDANSEFKINMIFDERQQRTNEAEKLNSQLDGLEASHQKMLKKYDNLSASYQNRLNEYNRGLKSYEKKVKEYNSKTDYWNEQGGAPEDEYEKLKDEKKELDATYKKLDRERSELNKLVGQVNNVASEEGKLVSNYNNSVTTYQMKYGGQREFEKGVFNGEAINIYEYRDPEDLRLTVVHEFGHALGIDHVSNPVSIMYPMIGEQEMENPILTAEDLNELRAVCKLNNK
jgi:hypothetical protein